MTNMNSSGKGCRVDAMRFFIIVWTHTTGAWLDLRKIARNAASDSLMLGSFAAQTRHPSGGFGL